MPRANIVISCKFPQNININHVSQAISDVVRSLTGSNVQVIANEQQTKLEPVDIYTDRKKKTRNSIQMVP